MNKKIIFLFLLSVIMLFQCKKDHYASLKKDAREKSIPFYCSDTPYFVNKSDSPQFNNVSNFTHSNSNSFYCMNKSKIYNINYNTQEIISEISINNDSIISQGIAHNKQWWLVKKENKNYNKFKVLLMDMLGNINATSTDLNYNACSARVSKTSDNGCIVALTANDSSFMATYGSFHFTGKFSVFRFDQNANLIWTKEYNNYGYIYSITESANGDFFIGGDRYQNTTEATANAFLDKLDKDGNLLWEKQILIAKDFNEDYSIENIIELTDGNFILKISHSNGPMSYSILKIDSSGNIIWTIPENYNNLILFPSSSGKIIIGHTVSDNINGRDIGLASINNNGVIEWKKKFGGTGDEDIYSIIEIPSIGYYLIGQTINYTGTGRIVTVTNDYHYYQNDCSTNNYIIKTDFQGNTCK